MKNRHFTRVKMNEWATIRHDDHTFGGEVDNISLRGLFIQTSQSIPLNTPVEVSVHHALDTSLDMSATVVRQGEAGLGMQIDRMDIKSLAYIRNLVAQECENQEQVMQETKKMVSFMLR